MEYTVAARTLTTYEALAGAVQERHLPVSRADVRHLTLSYELGGTEGGGGQVVMCAVLDAGHGLSKLVLVGAPEEDERTADLLADVGRRVREAPARPRNLALAS